MISTTKYMYIVSYLCLLVMHNSFAKEGSVHIHGIVSIDIAVEKNEVLILMKSPAINLLGFEKTQYSLEEKKQVDELKLKWQESKNPFFILDAKYECKVKKSFLNIPQSASHNHTDIQGELHLECKKPLSKSQLKINFESYSQVEQLRINLINSLGEMKSLNLKQSGDIEL